MKTKPVFYTLLMGALLMFRTEEGAAQSAVDSLVAYYSIENEGGLHKTRPLYELFVSDTAGVGGIYLKLGDEEGGNNLMDSIIVVNPNEWEVDATTNKFFYPVRVGFFEDTPPHGEVCLQSGGSCVASARRFRFVN